MFSSGFVGDFGKFANQFFKDVAHFGITDRAGMQVDVAKLFGDEVEQIGFGESVNLGLEVKAFEDITNGIGKALDVGNEILTDMVRVAHELVQS